VIDPQRHFATANYCIAGRFYSITPSAIAGKLTSDLFNNGAEQVRLVRHSFQHVRPALLKSKPRTGHEIPHRLRDQDFARSTKTGNTSADTFSADPLPAQTLFSDPLVR
jgi:hypothetical protein